MIHHPDVESALQQVPDGVRRKHAPSAGLESLAVDPSADLTVRSASRAHGEGRAHHVGLERFDGGDTSRLRDGVAERHRAGREAALGPPAQRLLDVHAQLVREELGEGSHHRQHHAARRRAEVDVLRHADKADARVPEGLQRLALHANVAGPPIECANDDDVEARFLSVLEKQTQLRTPGDQVRVRAYSFIRVEAIEGMALTLGVALDLCALCIKGVSLSLFLGRHAHVADRAELAVRVHQSCTFLSLSACTTVGRPLSERWCSAFSASPGWRRARRRLPSSSASCGPPIPSSRCSPSR